MGQQEDFDNATFSSALAELVLDYEKYSCSSKRNLPSILRRMAYAVSTYWDADVTLREHLAAYHFTPPRDDDDDDGQALVA